MWKLVPAQVQQLPPQEQHWADTKRTKRDRCLRLKKFVYPHNQNQFQTARISHTKPSQGYPKVPPHITRSTHAVAFLAYVFWNPKCRNLNAQLPIAMFCHESVCVCVFLYARSRERVNHTIHSRMCVSCVFRSSGQSASGKCSFRSQVTSFTLQVGSSETGHAWRHQSQWLKAERKTVPTAFNSQCWYPDITKVFIEKTHLNSDTLCQWNWDFDRNTFSQGQSPSSWTKLMHSWT